MPDWLRRWFGGSARCAPFLIRCGVLYFFFLASAHADELDALKQRAQTLHLAEQRVWKALLHQRGDDSLIEDPHFILTRPDFSARGELDATLTLLFSGSDAERRAAQCRYPARYVWLSNAMGLSATDPSQVCAGIGEFFAKAPAERISLVFASENLTSPSSMMGHVLLKLLGKDQAGRPMAHAISFFTEIRGINVPKILFDSLVVGKRGYYTLSPYAEKETFYREREQRNLWEYPLQLTAAEKQRLLLHLWELRDARLTYYFHRYNCATLTRFLLAVADPSMLDAPGLWTTPLDVVRALQRTRLLGAVEALPSDRWLAEALSRQLPQATVLQAQSVVSRGEALPVNGSAPAAESFLAQEFALAWADYAASTARVAESAARGAFEATTAILKTRFADQIIDLKN